MSSSSPDQMPDVELPRSIGRYEVLRLIGEGAMGRVLLAHDPVLGRDVAVKLLRDDLLVPRDVRQGLILRMRNEARAAARVAHPNLVTLHDMGEDPTLGLYLVFEYVEGPTLKQRLLQGPLPPEQAARLARDIGAALTFAHRAGILHRDIKPENIILSRTGGKLADFGIARVPDSTLTHAGGLMGTPAYSAPETFGGKNFSQESDQFSLAASLYEAVSGRRAFPGDDAVEVAACIASDTPARFAARRGLSTAVDDILQRAMAKAPGDRFPSCEAFGEALGEALWPASEASAQRSVKELAPQGRAASAEPRISMPPMSSERKRGQVLLGVAVVAVTAALLVRTAMRSETEERRPDASAADAGPTPEPSASASERPRAPASTPSQRTPRLHPSAEPTASADPASSTDAGPPDAAAATEDAGPTPLDAGPAPTSSAATTAVPAAPAASTATPAAGPSAQPAGRAP